MHKYLNMRMIGWCNDKLGKAFAKPHSNISFHVDSKRFKSFLQTADGKITQTADILSQVNSTNLGHAQTAHGNET